MIPDRQNLSNQVQETDEPAPKKQNRGSVQGNNESSSTTYQVPLADKIAFQQAKSAKEVPVNIRNRCYGGLDRYIKAAEAGRRQLNPDVITRYYTEKAAGNMFSLVKEFVADTSCNKITIAETHETRIQNTNEEQYEWVTKHDLEIRHKAYKFDAGKIHVEEF